MQRIFFALKLNELTKIELEKLQEKACSLTKKGRFVPPSLFHMTLQFLGELEDEEVLHLKELQFQWLEKFEPIALNINLMGCFQKRNRCILWAGVEKNPALDQLASLLLASMEEQGFINRHSFNPHITLAREVQFNNEEAQLTYDTMAVAVSSLTVDGFHLIESKRVDGRLQYNSLKKFFFGG